MICQKLAPWHQIWAKTHTVSSCDTISVASRLFHIILISPMTGVRVTQEHLMAYWCQAMAHFELWYVKNWHLDIKSGPKLTLFQGVTPYLLLPDYFISSSYLQWMMLGWPKSIWWPIGVRPWHILSCGMSKIGTLTSNLGQNSHCFVASDRFCCCQTISYHPHISNEWC
jgi:hypothetical protein